jgi:hypothetical protein
MGVCEFCGDDELKIVVVGHELISEFD